MGTTISYNHCNEQTSATGQINGYIDQVVDAVDRAYRYSCLNPALGAYAELDGYTARWVEVWTSYQVNSTIHLPAAAFGYAIESISTLMYLPDPPQGMAVVLQGRRGPTRPDIILTQNGADVAWIDITASGSSGHIWKKVGWTRFVNHCAEVVYDSINIGALNTNPLSVPDDVDENEALERIQFAKWLHRERRDKWKQRGEELFGQVKPVSADPVSRDRLRRDQAMGVLSLYFGPGVPEDELADATPHVLCALGRLPKTWGFNTGYGTSRSEGESFLLRYDPNLLTLELQKISIPRPLALSPFETPPWKVPQRNLELVPLFQAQSFDSANEDALVPYSRADSRIATIQQSTKKIYKTRIRLPKRMPTLASLMFAGPEGLFDFPDQIRLVTVLTRRKNTPFVRRLVARRSAFSTNGPRLILPSSLSKLGFGLSWNSDIFPLLRCLSGSDPSPPPTTIEPGDRVVGLAVEWEDGSGEVVVMDEELRAQLAEMPELLAIEGGGSHFSQ